MTAPIAPTDILPALERELSAIRTGTVITDPGYGERWVAVLEAVAVEYRRQVENGPFVASLVTDNAALLRQAQAAETESAARLRAILAAAELGSALAGEVRRLMEQGQ